MGEILDPKQRLFWGGLKEHGAELTPHRASEVICPLQPLQTMSAYVHPHLHPIPEPQGTGQAGALQGFKKPLATQLQSSSSPGSPNHFCWAGGPLESY